MSGDPRSEKPTLSREHVVAVLERVGLRGAEADRFLQGARFPMTMKELQVRAVQHGMTRDSVISALGGSP